MKKLILLLLFATLILSCSKDACWNQKEYDRILASIKTPAFPCDTVDITEIGARADDENFLNDTIINNAISDLSAKGGGVVKIPSGLYYTAGIILKDNMKIICQLYGLVGKGMIAIIIDH